MATLGGCAGGSLFVRQRTEMEPYPPTDYHRDPGNDGCLIVNERERWQNAALRKANTNGAVLDVLRHYLSQWTPEELAQLPAACRPGALLNAETVSEWAVHLARCELKPDLSPRSAALLRELTLAFGQASHRIAFLAD